jgi:hypothetical protein
MIAPPPLSLRLAFTTSLRALIESPTASLGEDACILDLAVESLERKLEGFTRSDLNLTHGDH